MKAENSFTREELLALADKWDATFSPSGDFPNMVRYLLQRAEKAEAEVGRLKLAGNELADKAQVLRINCGGKLPDHPSDKARLLEDMKALLDGEDGWSAALTQGEK